MPPHRPAAQLRAMLLDEAGRLYLDTDIGFGLVHTLDMEQAAEAVERALDSRRKCAPRDLPARFGFVSSPAGAAALG